MQDQAKLQVKSHFDALSFAVRIVTVAPFMALMLFSVVYALDPASLSLARYLASLVFMVAFPLSSYAVSALVPPLKRRGRKAQRNLAIAFSLLGYVGGVAFAFLTDGSRVERAIYLTYLFSGVLIALFSFAFRYKASGHASGVMGPVAMLSYLFGAECLLLLLLVALTLWASLYMRRHTVGQFALGCLFPVVSMFLAFLLV